MSNMQNQDSYNVEFRNPIRKIGKLTLLLALITAFIPAIYIALAYDAMPKFSQIMNGYLLIFSTEFVYYFIEPISYFPILGEAGTYMSFLAGSVMSIRMPAVMTSQETLDVEAGSKKGEVVSTIAIAASVICSMIMCFIAIVLGNVLFEVLPVFVQDMFGYVVPCLYGSMLMMFAPKNPKIAIVGLIIGLFVNYSGLIPESIAMLLAIFLTIAIGMVLGKKDIQKQEEKQGEN